jgi:hypothetical protein
LKHNRYFRDWQTSYAQSVQSIIGAMAKRCSNMLFSLNFLALVDPIDFGSTDNLKHQN